MTVGIEKGRDTDGCQGWPFWGGTIWTKTWITHTHKKSQSFKELDIKRKQMQKLKVEVSFEIFEE